MSVSVVFPFVMSAFVIATCQQPVEDKGDMYSDVDFETPEKIQRYLLGQCETLAENLADENERLKEKIEMLELRLKRAEVIRSKTYHLIVEDEREGDEEEEDEESQQPGNEVITTTSTPLRKKRGAGCEGGTLAAWACAPQCIFKLKGLCGLSLKSICHC